MIRKRWIEWPKWTRHNSIIIDKSYLDSIFAAKCFQSKAAKVFQKNSNFVLNVKLMLPNMYFTFI